MPSDWAPGPVAPLSCLVLHRGATHAFGRADLHRHFPLWAISQPYYVLVIGALGTVGRFSWKRRQYRRGEVPD